MTAEVWFAGSSATGIAGKGATREAALESFNRAAREYADMLALERDSLAPPTAALLADLEAGNITADQIQQV